MKLAERSYCVHLALINIWGEPYPRWPPQPTDLKKQNVPNSVIFTDVELNVGVVDETDSITYSTANSVRKLFV